MSAKLLEHFDLLATAPDGVARLRELILTLAVQGKLVPQDPNDEPASVLLQRIRAEKDRLIADKKIRRTKQLDAIQATEIPPLLPESWVAERLGNLGDWGAGATPSRSNSIYYGGTIPWFKSGELTADVISYSEETVTEAALRDCSLRLNQPGDVLVAMYGATIGKTAILSITATTNQAVCACTPFDGLRNTYLLLMLKAMRSYFISLGAGGAQPNISREKIISTVIGLPPPAEQSRIVARVQELMRLCDALEAKRQLDATQHAQLLHTLLGTLTDSATPEELAANWQRVATHFDLLLDRPEAVDALEQTILQLAVRGLLVPQDPNDEPASVLLQRIRAEKDRLIAEGKIKRDKPLPPITEEDKPFELPPGWEWVPVDALAHVGTGTTPSRDNEAYFSVTGIPWITSGETGQSVITQADQFVTARALSETSLTLYPIGTLIVAMYGQGKTRGQVAELGIEATTNQACAAIVLVELSASHRQFIKLVFEKSYDEIRSLSAGGAQPNLNVGKVKQTLIPLPPLPEQARIVARVAQLRRLCADLGQRLTQSQTTQAALAEALVESV